MIDVNKVHFLNIYLIEVTSDESKYEKSIFVIFDNPSNILSQFVNETFQNKEISFVSFVKSSIELLVIDLFVSL